jgi:quinol monooxygenase YgiN
MAISLVALVVARPETAGLVRESLMALAAPTRREAGCLAWGLHECGEAPGTFITIESWANDDSIATHMASAHVEAASAKLTPLLASPLRFFRLNRIV